MTEWQFVAWLSLGAFIIGFALGRIREDITPTEVGVIFFCERVLIWKQVDLLGASLRSAVWYGKLVVINQPKKGLLS